MRSHVHTACGVDTRTDAEADMHTRHVRTAIGDLHKSFQAPIIGPREIYQPQSHDRTVLASKIYNVSDSSNGRDL